MCNFLEKSFSSFSFRFFRFYFPASHVIIIAIILYAMHNVKGEEAYYEEWEVVILNANIHLFNLPFIYSFYKAEIMWWHILLCLLYIFMKHVHGNNEKRKAKVLKIMLSMKERKNFFNLFLHLFLLINYASLIVEFSQSLNRSFKSTAMEI